MNYKAFSFSLFPNIVPSFFQVIPFHYAISSLIFRPVKEKRGRKEERRDGLLVSSPGAIIVWCQWIYLFHKRAVYATSVAAAAEQGSLAITFSSSWYSVVQLGGEVHSKLLSNLPYGRERERETCCFFLKANSGSNAIWLLLFASIILTWH